LPGLIGIKKLHPYEYAYYNSFVGGTKGAFRTYETEYWLTCYKEAVEQLNDKVAEPINLFVYREPYVARYYASENVHVFGLRENTKDFKSGDYALINSRTNEDRRVLEDQPVILEIVHDGVVLCVVKQQQ
jgi:hypothetical protein